jgi:hypothetical protein
MAINHLLVSQHVFGPMLRIIERASGITIHCHNGSVELGMLGRIDARPSPTIVAAFAKYVPFNNADLFINRYGTVSEHMLTELSQFRTHQCVSHTDLIATTDSIPGSNMLVGHDEPKTMYILAITMQVNLCLVATIVQSPPRNFRIPTTENNNSLRFVDGKIENHEIAEEGSTGHCGNLNRFGYYVLSTSQDWCGNIIDIGHIMYVDIVP